MYFVWLVAAVSTGVGLLIGLLYVQSVGSRLEVGLTDIPAAAWVIALQIMIGFSLLPCLFALAVEKAASYRNL